MSSTYGIKLQNLPSGKWSVFSGLPVFFHPMINRIIFKGAVLDQFGIESAIGGIVDIFIEQSVEFLLQRNRGLIHMHRNSSPATGLKRRHTVAFGFRHALEKIFT